MTTTETRCALLPVTPALAVRSSEVSWGTFQADGTLGYDGGCCPAPRCRADLRDCALLSAHAPSRVEIETSEPVELFGFLNASARFDPTNPIEFWADWNFVGDVTVPGEATAPKRLEPGKHVLVATCRSPDWRHTLWAARRASPRTPAELEVLTIAAYPEERVPIELALLARSARKLGIELNVCFTAERYTTHAEMKIERIRRVIECLHAPRVLYVDGRDCVFLAHAERILEQLEGLSARLVMSTEADCWPANDADWAARFPRHPSGCNWLNAGQWLGEREAVVRALRVLEELDERAARNAAGEELQGLELCRRYPHDDQLLWQIAALNGLVEVKPDYEGRIFRNVNTLDMSLVENRDFDLKEGVVFRASGRRPCVLHFSGSAGGQCMQQWAGLLGAY